MSIANNIIDAMLVEVDRYKLELLQRYPDDLLIHDRNALSRSAHAGSKFCWMVGDSHTHLARLGVHPKLNEYPTFLTNCSSNDRFYVIDVARSGVSFTLKEVTRESFPSLAHTPIPYKRVGAANGFWLYKNDARVGTCTITRTGTYEKPVYDMKLTVMAGTSEADKVALEDWAMHAAVEMAGTLFVNPRITWEPAIELALAA
jgi:hypothetical protein